MNDPNGLMALRRQDGSTFPAYDYHMYFQSQNPGQQRGSEWGHAISQDLVNWKRLNRTGVRGSSGGGVALPAGVGGGVGGQDAWRAAVFTSAPDYPQQDPVGLSVWYSEDHDLLAWQPYTGKSATCNGSFAAAVVCPGMVPDSVGAGYIGDNYVWEAITGTYYLLSGSNKCIENNGKPWCGYGSATSTPQALLFRSSDLVSWEFVNVFWSGAPLPGKLHHNRVDTPDTFPLADGSQAFVWLSESKTVWMRGTFDRDAGTFKQMGGELEFGVLDQGDGGQFYCQQSFQDPGGSGGRVQFGWIRVEGDGWSGVQSLPRKVQLSEAAQTLTFAVHPSVWTLHGERGSVPLSNVSAGSAPHDLSAVIPGGIGLQLHVRIEVTLPLVAKDSIAFLLNVLGGVHNGGSTVTISGSGEATPAGNSCNAQDSIVNNSDTSGFYVGATPILMDPAIFGMAGATLCREMCCNTTGCVRWTYTDPQPGSSNHECWLKGGYGVLTPNVTEPPAHLWSGLVGTQPPAPPPPATCASHPIENNTDTSGNGIPGYSPHVMNASIFGLEGAAQCRQLCCNTTGCVRWTFSDPQPGSTDHDCWLKDGSGSMVFPATACGPLVGAHCWAGELQSPPPPPPFLAVPRPLSVSVNGDPGVNITDSSRGQAGGGRATAVVDVFVDGGLLEVFANDGEVSATAVTMDATLFKNASFQVVGNPSVAAEVAITVWEMHPSIISE